MKRDAFVCTFSIAVLAFIGLGAWGIVRTVRAIQFKQNCGGYLVRAAQANTVEMAERELARAVQYMDSHDLKTGYTSVLYRTPDEDVGFWYNNMTQSLAGLRSIRPEASALERSNVLMKLRESIIHHQDKEDSLIVPEGISVYPANTFLCFLGWLSAVVLCLCFWRIMSD